MSIKIRLSVQFTLVVIGILFFFSVLVYYFSFTSQRSKFRELLLEKAQNTAILLISVEGVDSNLLKKIHETTSSLVEEEIALTDSTNNLIYSNNTHYLSPKIILEKSYNSNINYFSIGEKDGVSYNHRIKNNAYHVYVLAYDNSRAQNLIEMRTILFWSILFSVWLSISASYFFSKLAIKPISNIISEIKEINSSKLNRRLNEGRGRDEIEQLATTFNQMLTDLELVFKSQNEFVSNASHELRTPLAIIIAESEYILGKERKQDEYVKHISGMVDDMRKLNALLNSLLELAQLNRDTRIFLSPLRIDELIFSTIQEIKTKYPGRKILPKIEYSDNENDLLITGNSGLLEIAFKNLIDNACKFSNGEVEVKLSMQAEQLSVRISDHGIGVPNSEMENIFKPFRRGENVKYIGGFGIGLSIVAKIIELHGAKINVSSAEKEGACFEILFSRKIS
ncbi:MAG TPA: HAMP domain-containing sensor histidine kinase [Prolixibacteraceae bacterium]